MNTAAPMRLGPFELVRPLGRGGMGQVWYGHHITERVPVAVKVMTGALATRPGFLQAMQSEVHAVARLVHPGIIQVYDLGELTEAEAAPLGDAVATSPYLVMEFAPHGSLTPDVVHSWDDLRHVLLALLESLAYAHARGVIHRDLKPANILLARKRFRAGSGGPLLIADVQLKLSDFGLAHAHDHQLHRAGMRSESIAGTPSFMAPEQLRGAWREEGPWTDLYALGTVAHLLATGALPARFPLPELEPRFPLPTGLDAWLERMLSPRIADRFFRAADARHALLALEADISQPGAPWHRPAMQLASPEMPLSGAGLGLFGLKPLPVVGRADEREALWSSLLEVCHSRRAHVVIVHGRMGMGKTRLMEWLAERAHAEGLATPLSAGHSEIPGARPALSAMLSRHLRGLGLERSQLLEHLEHILPRYHAPLDDALSLPALAEILAEGTPGDPLVRFSSQDERWAVMRKLIARMARQRPILVGLDDVQNSLEALDFVQYLLRHERHALLPLCIVLGVRDDLLGERPDVAEALDALSRHERCDRIPLEPLTAVAHSHLVEQLLGLEPSVARQVAERTHGNPMFAVQLVGDWIERGVLVRGPLGFELQEGFRHPVLPDDIHTYWTERLSHALGEDSGVSLELAAALGTEIDHDLWLEVCRAAGLEPELQLLDRLLQRGIILRSEGGWRLAHEMLAESLERHAREQGRWASHHAAIVSVLNPGREPERVALHRMEAGEGEAAFSALLPCVEQRRHAADFRRALQLLRRCDDALRSSSVPAHDPRWGELGFRRAHLAVSRGDLEEAELQLMKTEQEVTRHAWTRLNPALCWLRGVVSFKRGELQEAIAFFHQAQTLANHAQDRLSQADAMRGLGEVYKTLGEHAAARHHLREALALYRQLDQPVRLGNCLNGLAGICWRMGDDEDANAYVAEALEGFTRNANLAGQARCLNNMGEAARYRGDTAEAERCYTQALRLARSLELPMARVTQLNLAMLLVHRGELDEAHRQLARCRVDFELAGERVFLAFSHALLLVCFASTRAWSLFDQHLEQAKALLAELSLADADIAWPIELAASHAAEVGEIERARAALSLALAQRLSLGQDERAAALKAKMGALEKKK